MGIFLNNEDFLPGIITEIESDYSLGYSSGDFGSTEELLLFGTAFNGPVGKPIPVYNPEHGEYMFGKAYNPETRKEASLPTAIKDAYDRGARNIYAVRISGKQVHNDFTLAADTELKLRVSSLHPSNGCKDAYFLYDDSMPSNAILTLYKPAVFATIAEKNQGLVDDVNAQMAIKLDIEQSHGLSKNSKLLDFISLINGYGRNNVIRLGVVDGEGNDVTHTVSEVHELTLGDLLPGAYFIGRDNAMNKALTTEVKYKIDDTTGAIKKVLITNNDVAAGYPISGDALSSTNVHNALINTYNLTKLFNKDSVDYEEVDLSPFEIYERLGSGYATTASLRVTKTEGEADRYTVVQTPDNDPQKVVPLVDGIYSVMENMGANSRVLTCGSADERVRGFLPKLEDFKYHKRSEAFIFNSNLKISSRTEKEVEVEIINEKTGLDILSTDIDVSEVYHVHGEIPAKGKDKEIIIALDGGALKFKEFKTSAFEDHTGISSKYVLGAYDEKVYIYEVDTLSSKLTPICDYYGFINKSTVLSHASPMTGDKTKLVIRVFDADLLTLIEFFSYVEANSSINRYVMVSLTEAGINNEEAYIGELVPDKKEVVMSEPVEGWDTNLKIPYTTTDNFARQLAQHCTYTGLKTAPTKGFIGLQVSKSVELEAIAHKVDTALQADFDLYAKKENGKNMLDRNNLPYHIGRNISITLMQYPVYLDGGYTHISNGAAGYAGSVTALPLDQSSTNQPFDIPSTMINLSNYQLTKLTQRGFVTCKNSFTKGLVITDGITMALADSSYKRLSTIRTIGAVDDIIREATEPYIGKQNNLANRNALNTAIKSKLNMVRDTLIQNYEFEILYDARTAKFGNIDIDYAIVPIYEIRKIRNRISIKDTI